MAHTRIIKMTDWGQDEWITLQINRHVHTHPDGQNADPAPRSSTGAGIHTQAPLIQSVH